jgi:hypothetical protein
MKTLISPEYAALNQQLHVDNKGYGDNAGRGLGAEVVAQGAKLNGYKVILDYGCGKGALKKDLKKIMPSLKVLEYDPAIPGKNTVPTRRPDLITCLDVLEHVEPEFLDSVLEHIHSLQAQAVMLLIALEPANKILADGRNAHLIVESADWWKARLNPYFREVSASADTAHLLFVGVPLPIARERS